MIDFIRTYPTVVSMLPILPIVVPLFCAALVLMVGERAQTAGRVIAWTGVLALIIAGLVAVDRASTGYVTVTLVGNWQAPFGIALAIDKLTAMMLLLTAILSAVVLLAAQRARLDHGGFFLPLFMLQLMGLNGAFLTGDIFNLFVFFEVLLAASYGLLLQYADRTKTNAATQYVVINLVGSALFIIAAALLYGITGTLNMADLSIKLNALPPDSRGLANAAGFILITVFAVKAALLPLNFWLTTTYRAAILPVAALFVVMTKVGVVAIIRTLTLIYPDGTLSNIAMSRVLIIIAPITMLVAAFGALAAREVRTLIGWSIVGAAGLLITAVAIGNASALSGALFYLVGSTLGGALLFLNAAAIDETNHATHVKSSAPTQAQVQTRASMWRRAGGLFLIGGICMAGLPPLSGFIGKAVILSGAAQHPALAWLFATILGSSLMTIVAYARMGSRLFLKHDSVVLPAGGFLPSVVLVAGLIALTIFAAPITRYTDQAAIEMRQPQIMTGNVLDKRPMDPIKQSTGDKMKNLAPTK